MQIIFQDPYASLDPRSPIGDSIGDGLRIQNIGTSAERREKVKKIMDLVGLGAVPGATLSARVLGRAAAAHRHRPRADPRARPGGLRRARQRARRFDPGAGAQPSPGPSARAGPDVALHRPQHGRRRAHQRPRGGDVPRPRRRAVRAHARLFQTRAIPTRRRSCRRSRCPIRTRAASESSCAATYPVRSTCPAGCRFHPRCWLYEQLGKPENCRTDDPELRQYRRTRRAHRRMPLRGAEPRSARRERQGEGQLGSGARRAARCASEFAASRPGARAPRSGR